MLLNPDSFIATGPALTSSCNALEKTNFTIEFKSKPVAGLSPLPIRQPTNVIFQIVITSPNGRVQQQEVSYVNGRKCDVEIMFQEGGRNVIEVILYKTHIRGSPYCVNVNFVTVTTVPRWHVFSSEKKKWTPYPKKTSEEIERSWQKNPTGFLHTTIIQNGVNYNIQINFENMEEINPQKPYQFFFLQKSPILRATWFWHDDTGNFAPYPREISERLENLMDGAWFKNSQNRVDVSQGKKNEARDPIFRRNFPTIPTST